MASNKLDKFISSLTDKTKYGLVDWKDDGSKTFKFSTSSASVIVTEGVNLDAEKSYTSIAVYNDKGDIVDAEESWIDFGSVDTSPLAILYTEARRSALKADDVFASILDEIEGEQYSF